MKLLRPEAEVAKKYYARAARILIFRGLSTKVAAVYGELGGPSIEFN
jgi:hypothetical protein